MKKYWNLFWHFRKIQLMRMIEYRGDFIFWMIVSLMWTAFNYFFYSLIIGNSADIAGWSYNEVIVLLSFFTMIDALTWSVFYPNMNEYTESIYDGSLSKLLLVPISSIFIILNKNSTYHNVPRFFVGLIILVRTIFKMGITPTLSQIILSTFAFLVGVVFLYSGWFLLATTAFWVERLKSINEIMPGLRSIYQMPVSIFSGVSGFLLTFVIPLGLVTTLPSEILLGKSQDYRIIYFTIFTIAFAKAVYLFYKYSSKKYASVGS